MKKIAIAGLAVLLSAPMASFAYDQGNMLVRVGVSSFDTDIKGVDSDEQLSADFSYFLTDTLGIGRIGVEGSISMPVDLKDNGDTFADFLPLTVTAQYYFNTGTLVTPYAGVGLNYSLYDSKESGLDVDDSFGPVLQAGADFAINDNWGVNVNVRKIDMDFDYEINVGPVAVKGSESADTTVVTISGIYRF